MDETRGTSRHLVEPLGRDGWMDGRKAAFFLFFFYDSRYSPNYETLGVWRRIRFDYFQALTVRITPMVLYTYFLILEVDDASDWKLLREVVYSGEDEERWEEGVMLGSE